MDAEATVLQPTHSCFDDAMEFIEWIAKNDPQEIGEYAVVHAICLGAKPFTHAWVERGDKVIFAGRLNEKTIYIEANREDFHHAHNVLEFTTYSLQEVEFWNRKSGTFGPWESQYVAHCGGGQHITLGGAHIRAIRAIAVKEED